MEKVKKILAIGNSFSEDGTYYLNSIGHNVGIQTKVVNLYIPGCTLRQHWQNLNSNQALYRYELNGMYDLAKADLVEHLVRLQDVIQGEAWDDIILQQASHESGFVRTYRPYCENIVNYLKTNVPGAKIWLQQTWAYESDSDHEAFKLYQHSQEVMFTKLREAYQTIAAELKLELIPTGSGIQALRQEEPFIYQMGGKSLCRDGYHLSFLAGRFCASLILAQALLKIDPQKVTYEPRSRFEPEGVLTAEENKKIKAVVASIK